MKPHLFTSEDSPAQGDSKLRVWEYAIREGQEALDEAV